MNAEAPILWPPDMNNWLTGKDPDARKDWGQEEKPATEDEMVGWHHWLNELEQTPGNWTGKLGVLQSTGSQRVGYDWATEQMVKNLLHTSWLFAKTLQTFFFFFFEKGLRAQSYKDKEWTKSVGKRPFILPVKLCSSSWRSIKGWKKDQMRKKYPPHLVIVPGSLQSVWTQREALRHLTLSSASVELNAVGMQNENWFVS